MSARSSAALEAVGQFSAHCSSANSSSLKNCNEDTDGGIVRMNAAWREASPIARSWSR